MKTVIKFFGFVFGVIAELFVHDTRKAADTTTNADANSHTHTPDNSKPTNNVDADEVQNYPPAIWDTSAPGWAAYWADD